MMGTALRDLTELQPHSESFGVYQVVFLKGVFMLVRI